MANISIWYDTPGLERWQQKFNNKFHFYKTVPGKEEQLKPVKISQVMMAMSMKLSSLIKLAISGFNTIQHKK